MTNVESDINYKYDYNYYLLTTSYTLILMKGINNCYYMPS